MAIEITQTEFNAWNGTLEQAVADYAAAMAAHAGTEGVARPVGHPLVEMLVMAGGYSQLSVVPNPTAGPPAGMTVAQARAWATRIVNEAAENARLQYITAGTGQALTYSQKKDEAVAWNAAGRAANPAPGLYPMLDAERDAAAAAGDSVTFTALADEVLTLEAQWKVIGSSIEKARRQQVRLINKAATVNAATALAVWTWSPP